MRAASYGAAPAAVGDRSDTVNIRLEKRTKPLPLPDIDDKARRFGKAGAHAPPHGGGLAMQHRARCARWRGRCPITQAAVLVVACMTFTLLATVPAAAQCPAGQVWDEIGRHCRTGSCPEGELRTADGRCECPPGYARQGFVCLPSPSAFRRPPPSGCPTNEVRGPNGQCICRDGYSRVGSTCVPSSVRPPSDFHPAKSQEVHANTGATSTAPADAPQVKDCGPMGGRAPLSRASIRPATLVARRGRFGTRAFADAWKSSCRHVEQGDLMP